jgi:hypothetical protein
VSSPVRRARLRPEYQPRARKSRPGTWTDERVLAALRDWFDTFGRTPLSYEWSPSSAEVLGLPLAGGAEWRRRYPRWPSTATVCRHFGSWAGAVREAKLPPARAIALGRGLEERVEAARRLNRAGYRTSEIAALLEISARTVRSYLRAGTCRDCGTAVVSSHRCRRCTARRRNPPHWTRRQVLRALATWVAEEGGPPASSEWTPSSVPTRKWAREYPRWPSLESVRTLFGSWRNALDAAGCGSRRRRWDREEIIGALGDFANAKGRTLTHADLERRPELPSPGTVRAHFGSLQAAREAARLPVPRRRWNRDLIVSAIRRHAEEHGRLPASRDWQRSTSAHPHATTVLQHFGSWSAAIAEAAAVKTHSR